MNELSIMMSVGIVGAVVVYCQRQHYVFIQNKLIRERNIVEGDVAERLELLEDKINDLKDLQKRVDVLTLKAGFKL